MSNFWQGFEKRAGMFDFGLKPDVLRQVERFNQNLDDLKEILKAAPGQWQQTGENVAREAGQQFQQAKRLDKRRLLGYAALAGGGLAAGGALGNYFAKKALPPEEKIAGMITHALKNLRRGRNAASGSMGKGGYRLDKTTIRYPKK